MAQRVLYPDHIEPLVQFVEETDPRTDRRRHPRQAARGHARQDMLLASALAVTRSSDLPPGHHGGPLHPLAGSTRSTTLERGCRASSASCRSSSTSPSRTSTSTLRPWAPTSWPTRGRCRRRRRGRDEEGVLRRGESRPLQRRRSLLPLALERRSPRRGELTCSEVASRRTCSTITTSSSRCSRGARSTGWGREHTPMPRRPVRDAVPDRPGGCATSSRCSRSTSC